jgi:hypothetical protein
MEKGKVKKKQNKHRIPYETWINSQLSVVRHFGSCILNGKRYVLDYDNCRTKIDPETQQEKYFPDLVEE